MPQHILSRPWRDWDDLFWLREEKRAKTRRRKYTSDDSSLDLIHDIQVLIQGEEV